MFGFSIFKKKPTRKTYDPAVLTPVIRAGICTGEKTAGFVENETGHFREVMLILGDDDLEEFRRLYGIEGDIKTIY